MSLPDLVSPLVGEPVSLAFSLLLVSTSSRDSPAWSPVPAVCRGIAGAPGLGPARADARAVHAGNPRADRQSWSHRGGGAWSRPPQRQRLATSTGGAGARRPMTTSAAVGKHSMQRWLMR